METPQLGKILKRSITFNNSIYRNIMLENLKTVRNVEVNYKP
jgi:hypothetical protein